ncbi:MAG TPA: hypothetical protein VNK52_03435 [Hyphomicrobiaceae bacterium]|nr:hypothetical protein [Hyphomicrobiaceae bacterium]
MNFLADHPLAIAGALLLIAGFLIWRRMDRYDLKGAAIDSAWQFVRGRRTSENPTPIEAKLRDIGAASTVTGKASRAAGTVIAHFMAQVIGIAALVMMLIGLLLLAFDIWWR